MIRAASAVPAAGLGRRAFLRGLAGTVAGAGLAGTLPAVARAVTYGPPPGLVRLSANENPYGPSPKALEAIAAASREGAYYAGAVEDELRAMLAEANGVGEDSVVITTGSAEALCAATVAGARQGPVVAPQLTFSAHLRYAERLGAEIVRVPLTDAMDTDLDAMLAATGPGTGLVYLCNPNNPTGVAIDPAALRRFTRAASEHAPVLIDEAYNELMDDPAQASMVDLVRAGHPVVVTRTFSKLFGLAGLRVGYAIAPPELAATIGRHAMSWPNVAGLAAAIASYRDADFIAFSKARIAEGRRMIADTFERHGVPVLPSQANFVYADIGRDADAFQAAMRAKGVQIRGIYAPYDTWSRVSTGRLEDLETFARVFGEVYAG
jgi:histidinol-phosphate aminotransferase